MRVCGFLLDLRLPMVESWGLAGGVGRRSPSADGLARRRAPSRGLAFAAGVRLDSQALEGQRSLCASFECVLEASKLSCVLKAQAASRDIGPRPSRGLLVRLDLGRLSPLELPLSSLSTALLLLHTMLSLLPSSRRLVGRVRLCPSRPARAPLTDVPPHHSSSSLSRFGPCPPPPPASTSRSPCPRSMARPTRPSRTSRAARSCSREVRPAQPRSPLYLHPFLRCACAPIRDLPSRHWRAPSWSRCFGEPATAPRARFPGGRSVRARRGHSLGETEGGLERHRVCLEPVLGQEGRTASMRPFLQR